MQDIYSLPRNDEPEMMQQAMERVWKKVVSHNQEIERSGLEGVEYYLHTDWSKG